MYPFTSDDETPNKKAAEGNVTSDSSALSINVGDTAGEDADSNHGTAGILYRFPTVDLDNSGSNTPWIDDKQRCSNRREIPYFSSRISVTAMSGSVPNKCVGEEGPRKSSSDGLIINNEGPSTSVLIDASAINSLEISWILNDLRNFNQKRK